MTTKALDIYKPETYETMKLVAGAMASSGYFNDSKQLAQAIVKVMAGAELGLGPFASMTGISIIQGKPTLGANLLATLVKNDPRYDYRVEQCDNNACVLTWYENGEVVGTSSFTLEEAKVAGLAGKDNWKKYTSDMLFARAITRGQKRFAPGVGGGAPIYTPDELGADVDEDGNVIQGELVADTGNGRATPATDAANEELFQEVGTGGHAEPDASEPEPHNGNGARFASNIPDARAWVEEKIHDDKILLGLVADGLVMTGLYNDRKHVTNWLEGDECADLREKGLPTDTRAKVSGKGAMTVFDRAIDRKVEQEAA